MRLGGSRASLWLLFFAFPKSWSKSKKKKVKKRESLKRKPEDKQVAKCVFQVAAGREGRTKGETLWSFPFGPLLSPRVPFLAPALES
jgi:hypothetical protein